VRRLYLLFDSAEECQTAVEILGASGIDQYHLHAIASLSQRLDGLPKATVWQKTELAKGLVAGVLAGGLAGFCGGMLVVTYPPAGLEPGNSTVVLMTALGALFGLMVNALTKSQEHNHGLDRFRPDIEAGKILLMTDLPGKKMDELLATVNEKCPGMQVRN